MLIYQNYSSHRIPGLRKYVFSERSAVLAERLPGVYCKPSELRHFFTASVSAAQCATFVTLLKCYAPYDTCLKGCP